MARTERIFLWNRFTLQEALLLGFCATFIVLTRAGLRLHLHLPGHVMFFTMFFFVLARGWVPKIGSATLVGLIVSLASFILGMGTKGPAVLIKFVLPAVIVDLAGIIAPAFVTSILACIVVGAVAAAVRSVSDVWLEWFMGMEEEVIVRKAMITAAMFAVYGGLGSALVPSIVRKLRRNGLIPSGAGGDR